MARPIQPGLTYFPLDVSFFQDIKIRKLIKYQGCKAIPVYTLLLCNIYQNGYYMRWDKELPFIISETTGYEEGYVTEVIKCCLKVELFSNEIYEKDEVLTSKGIQERYIRICRQAKRRVIMEEFTLVNTEETNVSTEETEVNTEFGTQSKVKYSKVKKREEETNKENSTPTIPDFVKQEQDNLSQDLKNNPPEFRAAPLTLSECVEQMKNSQQLQETACMTRKISEEEFIQSVNEFHLEKKATGHAHKSYSDAVQHYLNWVTIWKAKKDKSADQPKGKLKQQANSLAAATQRIKQKGGYLTAADEI